MDVRNFIRPIIAGLVGLGVIVLVIVIFMRIFSGHGVTPSKQVDITKYADSAATVTLLVDEPTMVDQDHRQVRITVSETQNQIDVIQGYQGNVINTRTYDNNEAAFGTFLQTLKLLDFNKGDSSAASKDYRGYCPTGNRFVYTFNDGNKDLFTYWSTSCRGLGTFKGQASPVILQFRRQIPQADLVQLLNTAEFGTD